MAQDQDRYRCVKGERGGGEEQGYLDLVAKILDEEGESEERLGRNGMTLSVFGQHLEFNLSTGFPLLTTKRVFWRGVAEELFWFLRGSTDARELMDKGVHIWDGNSSREFLDSVGLTHVETGTIGAGYGFQWRHYSGTYPSGQGGVDQIRYILNELTDNPHSRRIVLNAWNPCQLSQAALPPCHTMYQFYVNSKGLSCSLVCRSQDIILGTPFNIASTALLTTLLAYLLHIPVHKIVINMGDTHIYKDHVEAAKQQLSRTPYKKPTLKILRPAPNKSATIDEKLYWLETLTFDDVQLDDYKCHPAIKCAMIA